MSPNYPIGSSRSSLELMLEEIQKREEQQKKKNNNVLPALPTRPVIKSRLPRSRLQILPLRFGVVDCCEGDQRMHMLKRSVTWREDDNDEDKDEDEDDDGSVYEDRSSSEDEVVDSRNTSFKGTADNIDEAIEVVDHSTLLNLRMRVVKTEALLEQKTQENASLQQQLNRFERKRKHYESKMKSMEKCWQDQLNSLQISLAAKRNVNPYKSKGKLGLLFGSPGNGDGKDDGFVRLTSIREFLDKEHDQTGSAVTLELELHKLKQKYKAWKKDFKKKLIKLGSIKNCESPEKMRDKLQVKGRILCF